MSRLSFVVVWFVLMSTVFATEVSTAFTAEEGTFIGASQEESPEWFKDSFLDFQEDVEEAAEEDKFIILYFHQNGCPYCAKMIRENFHNPALVNKIRTHADVIEINIFGDKPLNDWYGREFTEKTFSEALQIQFTPTLLFLNTDGEVAFRIDGYQSTENMLIVMDYLTEANPNNIDFNSYKGKRLGQLSGELIKEPFFDTPPYILSRSKQRLAARYLAVLFEVPNCISCEQFHQNILNADVLKDKLSQIQWVQLNALSDTKLITPKGNKTTAKNWYQDLKLSDYPAVVLFDKAGEEVIRKDAYFKSYHFANILEYAISGAHQTQPNFQRYIEQKSDALINQGVDVNIWQ